MFVAYFLTHFHLTLIRSYRQILVDRFAFLIPASEPGSSVSLIWTLGSIKDIGTSLGGDPTSRSLTCCYGDSNSGPHLTGLRNTQEQCTPRSFLFQAFHLSLSLCLMPTYCLGLGIPAAHLPLLRVRPFIMHLQASSPLRLVHYCPCFAGREVKHLSRLCW